MSEIYDSYKCYHASKVANLDALKPDFSRYGEELVYFSTVRENTLVYLGNAIERYCLDNNIDYHDTYRKWTTYGFTDAGMLCLDEYYPNAIEETYKGEHGYVYCVEKVANAKMLDGIRNVVVTNEIQKICSCEYIEDAHVALLKAVEENKIMLKRYEEHSEEKIENIKKIVINEYANFTSDKVYQKFLSAKFTFLPTSESEECNDE